MGHGEMEIVNLSKISVKIFVMNSRHIIYYPSQDNFESEAGGARRGHVKNK